MAKNMVVIDVGTACLVGHKHKINKVFLEKYIILWR